MRTPSHISKYAQHISALLDAAGFAVLCDANSLESISVSRYTPVAPHGRSPCEGPRACVLRLHKRPAFRWLRLEIRYLFHVFLCFLFERGYFDMKIL